jgi:hypothetical protein
MTESATKSDYLCGGVCTFDFDRNDICYDWWKAVGVNPLDALKDE